MLAFFDALPRQKGRAGRLDVLQLLDGATLQSRQAPEFAGALQLAGQLISQKPADELADLLVSLSAIRSQLRTPHDALAAIEQCVRSAFQSRVTQDCAGVLVDLDVLPGPLDDAATTAKLQDRLSQLPDESLFAAATSAQPETVRAVHVEIQRRYEHSGGQLEAVLAAVKAGLPTSINGLAALLRDATSALQAHERCSAIHGLPLKKDALALRMILGATLRGPLERVELPLHRATPGQQRAIGIALEILEPVQAAQPEDHFHATYVKQCLGLLGAGHQADALTQLRAMQVYRDPRSVDQAQQHPARQEPAARLQAALLDDLFKRLPRESLGAAAQAMASKPFARLMAALQHIGETVLAGQPLGREIAERHRELDLIRDALSRALAGQVTVKTIKFGDAIRDVAVQATLRTAFALELQGDGREMDIFAKTGPVRAQAQAVFDRAFVQDTQTGSGKLAEINQVLIAQDFPHAARRNRGHVFNPQNKAWEDLTFDGMSDTALVDDIMTRTGATPAQMTALSRIHDADGRINRTLCSPWSVLLFNGTPALPVLSASGQRESDVWISRDERGNLKVRFTTEFTGITRVLPLQSQRLLQPRAVAHGGNATFTHDVVIAPNGHCKQSLLQRDYLLQQDPAEPKGRFEQSLILTDLLRNPDALNALGALACLIDRKTAAQRVDFLQSVDGLMSINKENSSNLKLTANGLVIAFIESNERGQALGISAVTLMRIRQAYNDAENGVGPLVEALAASREEVAQGLLEITRAQLAASAARTK